MKTNKGQNKMKKLEKMIKTLPAICTDYDLVEDKLLYNQPNAIIYKYCEHRGPGYGDEVISISDEQEGNFDCFVYYGERVVDIKESLKEWASKYNKYWDCRYEGTFVLLDA